MNRRRFLLSALAAALPCCRGKDGGAAPWPKARGLWLSPPFGDAGTQDNAVAFLIGAPPDYARLYHTPLGRQVREGQVREWRFVRFVLYGSQINAFRSGGAVQCATDAEFAAAEQRLWDDWYRDWYAKYPPNPEPVPPEYRR